MKNITIVKTPYVYENAFKNDNGDLIEYAQLAVDVKVGDTICRLTKSLKGFEKEYIKFFLLLRNVIKYFLFLAVGSRL